MDHVLSLSSVGVEQWLHGPDTHSGDHSPIIGRVPGAENVVVSQASTPRKFNAVLLVGVAFAEYILDGSPHSLGLDFSSCESGRFFHGLCDDAGWVQWRAAETTARHTRPLSKRDLRECPLSLLLARACKASRTQRRLRGDLRLGAAVLLPAARGARASHSLTPPRFPLRPSPQRAGTGLRATEVFGSQAGASAVSAYK